MKSTLRAIVKGRLLKRMYLCIVLICVVPLLFLSLVMNLTAERSILDVSRQFAESAMDIVSYNIGLQFQKYSHLASFIARDQQIIAASRIDSVAAFNADARALQNYRQLLQGYHQSAVDLEYVCVSYDNGLLLSSKDASAVQADLRTHEWYQRCVNHPDQTHVMLLSASESPVKTSAHWLDIIVVCRAVCEGDQAVGVVVVAMSSNVVAQSATNVLNRKGSYLYITDQTGSLVYSPTVGVIPEADNSSMYLTVRRDLPDLGWQMTGMMFVQDAIANVRTVNRVTMVLCVIILLAVAVLALILSRRILRPIYVLNSHMKLAEQGNLEVRFAPRGNDEVNELGVCFNEMLEKIEGLLRQIYLEQKAKRKAEIAALQANINPHFLYNTLDTICWLASQHNDLEISETVEALSSLFRIALSKGSEIIPLEQELLHVKSYLHIQKVRYEDKLDYAIDADESLGKYMVQKLILQPLVENAIYHGIKESDHNGKIKISVCRQGQALLLRVEDDGIGMRAERLEEVRSALKGKPGSRSGAYGIINVQERLVLSYGREYGLEIDSQYGKGTQCVIHHPLIGPDREMIKCTDC